MAHSGNRKLSFSPLISPVCMLAIVLFLFNQWLEASGVYLPFLHSYLDDLLCLPIVLSITLNIQKNFTYADASYRFSIYHIIVSIIYFSLVFEWLLPQYSSRYTSDWLDIGAYVIGGGVFHRWMNR